MDPPAPTPWSSIVKQNPPAQPPNKQNPSTVCAAVAGAAAAAVGSCKSTKGIAVAVVDANAIIQGGEQLHHAADKFVSVDDVIKEVRDPMSRHRMSFLPFSVDIMEPSPESLKKVISFARATGDLQTLSDVDLKLIALTYTLESQIHGTSHLRETPSPIHRVNVKRLPEKDLLGWGSNVPNLAQWEALEHAIGDGTGPESRILPQKDLNINVVNGDKDQSIDDSVSANGSEPHDDGAFGKPRKYLPGSTVACVTADYAMQNVILQMGLRLVELGRMQIRELNRWVLQCHACFKVTMDIGKIFCPSCGNGGTLRKVAATVGENGATIAARRPRAFVWGTRFSLPQPKGRRDAITKNPILREDQLPMKYLHPKNKKKNKEADDIFATNELFTHHTHKKAPLQPPVRKALAVFSGRRNPNDNDYSRAKH